METTPALQITKAIRELRSGKISPDDYRSKMADLRTKLGEHGYTVAKMQAVVRDR